MNTEALGRALVLLGGGRLKTSDSIDFDVGFWFHRKLGDKVNVGDTLITLHYNKNLPEEIKEQCLQAISIQAERKPVPKLILDVML
jgi:pyrimidine-nucleoside phosphorylase